MNASTASVVEGIGFRLFNAEADAAFVFHGWLEGYWPHFPGNIVMEKEEWRILYHRVLERILADENVRTIVAHAEGDSNGMLGFACSEPNVCLHWLYVKHPFRRVGIGRALLRQVVDDSGVVPCTHWAPPGPRTIFNLRYQPELLGKYK